MKAEPETTPKNLFRIFVDSELVGLSMNEKKAFKEKLIEKLQITKNIYKQWYSGSTQPSFLEKKAINSLFCKTIFFKV